MSDSSIFEEAQITCSHNDTIVELIRGIRAHLPKMMKKVKEDDLKRASLGLAHSYSRHVCAGDPNKQDKPIMQTNALLEQLDKNINTFCMRLREWFSWHFPELGKIVTDNYIYTRIVNMIQNKEEITDDMKEKLTEFTLDEDKSQEIIDASKTSMGQELSEADQAQIKLFSERVAELVAFRETLQEYLRDRMNEVAPNLTSLIGENVGSKLITHSGSLINLAKYPASTI